MNTELDTQLAEVNKSLIDMTQLVGEAISKATRALLEADLAIAQEVIDGDEPINRLNMDVEELCMRIAALQAPIGTGLRSIMSGIRIATSLERMGDLAVHIAKQVRLRYPNPPIPAEVRETFAQMGEAANRIVAETGTVIASRDTDLADKIKIYDDELDRLHRELFTTVLSSSWDHGVEAAIDVTLLSRFYERFGDHAVTVARRVVHIVTGEPYSK